MKRFSKTLAAAILMAITLGSAVITEASGHGRSGGCSGGSGRVYSSGSSFSSHSPVHIHSRPVYSQHSYSQPAYSQHIYSQPIYSQPVPVETIQPIVYTQPALGIHQPLQQLQPLQPAQQQTPPPQQLQQLQPLQPLQVSPGQPDGSLQPGISLAEPPQQANPNSTATPNPPMTTEQQALDALGAFAPPSQSGANLLGSGLTMVQPLVGTWTAQLPNGANVRLILQTDGQFSWTATNAMGTTTSFSGHYTINSDGLNLSRSTDSQTLSGNTTLNGVDAFTFRLAGANSAMLEFRRS